MGKRTSWDRGTFSGCMSEPQSRAVRRGGGGGAGARAPGSGRGTDSPKKNSVAAIATASAAAAAAAAETSQAAAARQGEPCQSKRGVAAPWPHCPPLHPAGRLLGCSASGSSWVDGCTCGGGGAGRRAGRAGRGGGLVRGTIISRHSSWTAEAPGSMLVKPAGTFKEMSRGCQSAKRSEPRPMRCAGPEPAACSPRQAWSDEKWAARGGLPNLCCRPGQSHPDAQRRQAAPRAQLGGAAGEAGPWGPPRGG